MTRNQFEDMEIYTTLVWNTILVLITVYYTCRIKPRISNYLITHRAKVWQRSSQNLMHSNHTGPYR